MKRSSAWREYQERSAEFFRRLGLTATVEHRLEGARATHVVDVFVEGTYHGIQFKWILECKAWATNVPKEKVMALAAVVQDLGVDRGLLLSEKGFQAGAIHATRKTNITLTSLADLAETTEDHLLDVTIGAISWRRSKAHSRLREIKRQRYKDEFLPPTVRAGAGLFLLESMIEEAARNEYPIVYDAGSKKLETLDQFLAYAEEVISAAEKWSPPE